MYTYVDPATSQVYAYDQEQKDTPGLIPSNLVECGDRPSPCHVWQNGAWAEDATLVANALEDRKVACRNLRDAKLKSCDWTQLRDIPDATASLWVAYRQGLRDVPQQTGFPDSVTWPTPPA